MMYQRMSRYKKKINTTAYRGYNKIFKLQEHLNLTEDGYLNRFWISPFFIFCKESVLVGACPK